VIVLDTSALMALLLAEPEADQIAKILKSDEDFKISAGTLAEALNVAEQRGLSEEMLTILEGIAVATETVSAAGAIGISEAYLTWGKSIHPAGLYFGDCFSKCHSNVSGSSLLYVGGDFAKTDLKPAL
tara:strand:- start:154 stop:537 length:384 start_codon:yes stop_codon:yes gene_type:complete